MTLLALVLTLVLEQFRPLNAARYLHPALIALGQFFEDRFNDGQARHGVVAWCLLVLPLVAVVGGLHYWLYSVQSVLGLLFDVVVLYLTMGFRQASHFYTRIHAALRAQDLPLARQQIGAWRGRLHEQSGTHEIVRLALEQGIIGAHRQVFAIFVCFVLLGPAGAVLYRLADFYARHWGAAQGPEMGDFGLFARQAFTVIEWLPARVTAMAFSIVGDFEDAAYCWRTQANLWPDRNEGILLAAGAGALGVRIGQTIQQSGELLERPELGTGDEAEVEYLQSFVGLVRRTLVLNVLVLLMLSLTRFAA
ncbi:MAG: threonine-phosphate decarboxylase [Candidatus Dactylopiibacterium carminicum]|uniref:Cobalamin biosynthesis protein CobD n=1 Tax=Candidatus Dactylopiibacterium carminicum TaxID=857335 RepID=A0A272EQC8_9RHOO|nr:CobD/CbiB family protein [Candidatus Dactylopiibacterium carminicum]KAF7598564.1 threonine-phosphate decarboxylase [Candidatus Dactylopiibacterium carminicum]PAS92302.1 MAG: threonine-phosphate decarboxylase [Candidatus Dactylopiibacterium carminicum]PAS92707.1 MAG: threonine-phosphate decarboxylase [Candidatus Dactylopiibacterium carminicum]PAS98225.1 MAG: threonine-phosphate decarboxylase [Candidatus Dactylopiibacterium carminicum]